LTQLVSIEDTANRGGGAIYNFQEIQNLRNLCNNLNLPLHLDGARVFNALIENNIDFKTYGSQFDSISICLSKGLGAPVGSLLLGSNAFIKKAHRVRKVLGGGMRQAGIIAAGGLYALRNNVERLKLDHENAKQLEKELNDCTWVESVIPVQTNIVVAILRDAQKRDVIVEKLKSKNILIMPFGPGMLRMVTHLNINQNDIDEVSSALKNSF
jgi:threonine aldolase